MNEEMLRAMVREAVVRHLAAADPAGAETQPLAVARHASHFRYALTPSEGPCLIEPGVQCNHCGYCESHGH